VPGLRVLYELASYLPYFWCLPLKYTVHTVPTLPEVGGWFRSGSYVDGSYEHGLSASSTGLEPPLRECHTICQASTVNVSDEHCDQGYLSQPLSQCNYCKVKKENHLGKRGQAAVEHQITRHLSLLATFYMNLGITVKFNSTAH
jgi:hypothetical protein